MNDPALSKVAQPPLLYQGMIETSSNTSALATRLRERISNEGPLRFYDWMKAALYDPSEGYYCRADRNKWGKEGDYRTSPERSSLFAATFARFFGGLYDELGHPDRWTILEAGAGDGCFAGGVLEALRRYFPAIFRATTYVIDEVSLHSRSLASERLQQFGHCVEFKSLDEIEIDSGIVFSNELLDAFPVCRVTRCDGRLQEFYVNVGRHGDFEWLLRPLSEGSSARLNEYFEICGVQPDEGQIVEASVDIESWLAKVSDKMRHGYLVSVDYGATAAELFSSTLHRNGTLRGFDRHEFVADLLARPGKQDLTTTVNWTLVKGIGSRLGFETIQFERQDKFLLSAGLLEQLQVESRRCTSEAQQLRLSTAAREMILPGGMASEFQVLVQKKIG